MLQRRSSTLFKHDRERMTAQSERPSSGLRIRDLCQCPYLTADQLLGWRGLSALAVNTLADLQRLSVVTEVTGRDVAGP